MEVFVNVRDHPFNYVRVIYFNFVSEFVPRLVYIETGKKRNNDEPQLSISEVNR